MNVYVFLGSTLSGERACESLDAHYLPPIQQGDVLRLLPKKPHVIGIVDGLFRAVPSVWHKEILTALAQGCHVFGAASMGALRAAELHSFGMRGVGRIFEQYRDGTFEDDDEVAVAHASAEFGFRELSVPMVNIRDMLEQAERASVLTASEAAALVAHAKSRFYPERNVGDLLDQAKRCEWPDDTIRRLAAFFRSFGPTLKERDAVQMLREIHAFVASSPGPFPSAARVERTLFLHNLEGEVEREVLPRRTIDDATSLAETGLPLFALRKEALIQFLARHVSGAAGCAVDEAEIEGAWEMLRERAGLTDEAREAAWLETTGMSLERVKSRLRDAVALQKVEARFEHEIDRELPDVAAILSAFRKRA